MRQPNLKSVVEIIGTIAILAGLVLVAYELRQGHAYARAELSAESGRLIADINSKLLDPQMAALFDKSRTNPNELNRIERIQLDAYFSLVINLYMREFYNYNRGFFENYTDFPRSNAVKYFGSGYGKTFWERRRPFLPPAIVEVVDQYLQDPERLNVFEGEDGQ